MTNAFKFLGTTDEVNACDCCGKSNLKMTVEFEMVETGEVVHYGSSCATRHTGRKLAHHEAAKREEIEVLKKAVHIKVWQTVEHHALNGKFARREALKMEPGRAAREFLEPEYTAFQEVALRMCREAGVSVCDWNTGF